MSDCSKDLKLATLAFTCLTLLLSMLAVPSVFAGACLSSTIVVVKSELAAVFVSFSSAGVVELASALVPSIVIEMKISR